jgi:hypothetical protein
MDCSFPKSHYTLILDLQFKSYEDLQFKDFSQSSGMQSATANATNSAQICQNLPKFAQKRNFEIPPKIEVLVFLKNKKICV